MLFNVDVKSRCIVSSFKVYCIMVRIGDVNFKCRIHEKLRNSFRKTVFERVNTDICFQLDCGIVNVKVLSVFWCNRILCISARSADTGIEKWGKKHQFNF